MKRQYIITTINRKPVSFATDGNQNKNAIKIKISICILPLSYLEDQYYMYQSWSHIFTKEIHKAQGKKKVRTE